MSSANQNGALEKITFSEAMQMDFFSSIIDREEMENLVRGNPALQIYKSVLPYQREHFLFMYRRPNRRGEIVFLLENANKEVLLHTKPFFPNGVYRLLSGGINISEAVAETLRREVYEETGFEIDYGYCIAMIFFTFAYKTLSMPFISYLYCCPDISGNPVVQDTSEKISGFRWVTHKELDDIYRQLLNLPDDWKDWGVFRALPHKIFYDTLREG